VICLCCAVVQSNAVRRYAIRPVSPFRDGAWPAKTLCGMGASAEQTICRPLARKDPLRHGSERRTDDLPRRSERPAGHARGAGAYMGIPALLAAALCAAVPPCTAFGGAHGAVAGKWGGGRGPCELRGGARDVRRALAGVSMSKASPEALSDIVGSAPAPHPRPHPAPRASHTLHLRSPPLRVPVRAGRAGHCRRSTHACVRIRACAFMCVCVCVCVCVHAGGARHCGRER